MLHLMFFVIEKTSIGCVLHPLRILLYNRISKIIAFVGKRRPYISFQIWTNVRSRNDVIANAISQSYLDTVQPFI